MLFISLYSGVFSITIGDFPTEVKTQLERRNTRIGRGRRLPLDPLTARQCRQYLCLRLRCPLVAKLSTSYPLPRRPCFLYEIENSFLTETSVSELVKIQSSSQSNSLGKKNSRSSSSTVERTKNQLQLRSSGFSSG